MTHTSATSSTIDKTLSYRTDQPRYRFVFSLNLPPSEFNQKVDDDWLLYTMTQGPVHTYTSTYIYS